MRHTFTGKNLARIIEGQIQLTHDLVILPRRRNADRLAANPADNCRIRTRRIQPQHIEITKQRMRVAADDDINAIDGRCKFKLVFIAVMRQQDNVINA